MRVLFVSSGNSDRGIVSFIKVQGESLKENGIEVDYYLIKGKGVKGYIKNILPLRKIIKKGQYDLIHAHYSLSGWVARLAVPNIPLIVSLMGSDVYGGVDKKGKQKFSKNIYFSKILQVFLSSIIVKSQNLMDYVLFDKKAQIIPNGVDFKAFRPVAKKKSEKMLNLDLGKSIVLFLANPESSRKNIKLVKNALKKLNTKSIQLQSPYPLAHDDVPLYLNAADLLISTSYREGSPNIIKEAMACNCPIVSTNVGDVKWLFGDTPGHYLTSFDPSDVAEKILKALSFSKRFQTTQGRERLIELGLDTDTVSKKIIKNYKSVLKK